MFAWLLFCAQPRPHFTFQGGSAVKLAATLESTLKSPVAIMVAGPTQYKQVDFYYDDSETVRRIVRSKFQLSSPAPTDSGFGPEAWPINFFRKQRIDRYTRDLHDDPKPVFGRKGDLISLESSDKGYLSLTTLRGLLGVPITSSPLYEDARFIVQCHAVSPEQLMKVVAASLGAKLVVVGNGFDLKFDPTPFRTRAVAMCHLPSTEEEPQWKAMDNSDRSFLEVGLGRLTDAQLTRIYSGKMVDVPIAPLTRGFEVAMQRIDAKVYAYTSTELHQVASTLPEQCKLIDRSSVVYFELRQDGIVQGLYKIGPQLWLSL
jgi:hypothetical protein